MTRRTGPNARVPAAASDMSCVLAASGYLVRAGAGLQEATGRSAETLSSRPLLEFVHEGDRSTLEAALAWQDADGEPLVCEVRFRHADGTYRWFEWTVSGRAGDDVRRAAVRDVTRWKRDEALAVAHARALEAIVAEQPLSDVLAQIAGLFDAIGMDCHPAVHLTSEDRQALVLLWSPSIPESFARALEQLAIPGGPGAAVHAVHERKLVASPDLSHETHWRGRRELPLAHGLRAEWAQPVIDGAGDVRGTITLFLTQPALPAPRDRQVMALAAQLLLATLERGAARDALTTEAARLAEAARGHAAQLAALADRVRDAEEALEATRAAHAARVQALELQLADERAAREAAEARTAQVTTDLERRLDDAADALLRLRAELGQADERATQAQGEARHAEQARVALASTVEALRRASDEAEAARAAAERRAEAAEAQLATAQRERDAERAAAAAEAEQQRAAREQERAAAEQRLAAWQQEREADRAAEAARHEAALGALQDRVHDLEASARAGEVALEAAQAKLDAVRAELAATARDQEAIEARAREAAADEAAAVHRDAAAHRAWADAELAMLGLRVAELEGTRAGLEQAAHDARAAAAAAAAERDALLHELHDVRERLAEADRRRGEHDWLAGEARLALEELPTLRAQVMMLEGQRHALQEELRELRDRAPATPPPADLDEDMAALSARLAEAEAARQRLEGELATARQEAEDARRALDWERARCTEENDRLAQRLADAEAARAALATPPAPRSAPRAAWLEDADAAVEPETLDLSAFVERLRGELGAMLPPEAQLHVRLTPHLPPVAGEPAALRQVLAQLVSNAAEALEGRRGTIAVGTGVVDADRPYLKSAYFDDGLPEGRYAFLEVSDTGHGMPPEVQRQLFDTGFSTRAPGRGHGLATALGIVRAHRGAIQVYTKPDVGTTIRVLLPVATGRARRGASAPDEPLVLVVDRDPSMRAAASRILERWGFTVLQAGDFDEGAALLRGGATVRLVVLEANLPAADGPATTALQALRQDVRVLLAGEPNGSGNRAGASAVVARPFAPVELVAAVREALR